MKKAIFTVILFFSTLIINAQSPIGYQTWDVMQQNRMGHIHITLEDGRALLIGGHGTNFVALSTAELYQVNNEPNQLIQMNFSHDFAAIARGNNGNYYIFGGAADLGVAPGYNNVEYFDPNNEVFTAVSTKMQYGRTNNSAVLMNNGSILIAGGWYEETSCKYAEVYNSTDNSFTLTERMVTPRSKPILVPTNDGRVTVFGGFGVYGSPYFQSVEEYDPSTNKFTETSPYVFPEMQNCSFFFSNKLPGSNMLDNGKYVFQGYNYDSSKVFFFTFDPNTKQFDKININLKFVDDGYEFLDFILSNGNNGFYLISKKEDSTSTYLRWDMIATDGTGYHYYESMDNPIIPKLDYYLTSFAVGHFYPDFTYYYDCLLISGGTTSNDFYTNFNPVNNTFIIYQIEIGVEQEDSNIPNDFSLSQNYPNPFNPSTTIKFAVIESGLVTLKIYDILGKEVATLVNEDLAAGSYSVNFDPQKEGSNLASGMYIYKLNSNNKTLSKKMLLLK